MGDFKLHDKIMTKKHKNKSKKSKRNGSSYSNSSSMGNSMNTQVANIPRSVRAKTWEFLLKTTPATAITDGAGVLSLSIGVNTPSSTNNFSELSSLFDLYKIKKFTFYSLPFIPPGNSSTADYRPVYCLYDADASSTPVSSVTSAIQYDTVRSFSVYLPIKYSLHPMQLAAAAPVVGGWINVGTPSSVGQFQLYATSLDLSTTYATYYYEYVAVFKNVR